jgi:predicted DNA-binding transcriptional regulator AlpA
VERKLYTAKEIALRYGLHPKTVWKYARIGILPKVQMARRCVRFDFAECDAVLKRRTYPVRGIR